MKRKAFVPLVLGLFIGLLTVKFVVDAVRKAQASGQASATIKAVRAKQDINAFEAISAEMVELVETNDSLFAPANERIDNIDAVINRVTAKAIPAYAAVLKSMLAPEGTREGMVGKIPAGYRAVSVKIDEVTGVSYQLKPGDWVDVIVVMDVESASRGKKDTIAEVILQHLQVAAIGYATDAQAGGGATGSKVKPAKSATLLVPEEDVPKLHPAATRGKITLAMRGQDDKKLDELPFAHTDGLLSGTRPPEPAVKPDESKLPRWLTAGGPGSAEVEAPPHSILIFHGSPKDRSVKAMERITFENGRSSKIVDFGVGPPTRTLTTMSKPVRASSMGQPSTGGAGGAESKPSESGAPKTTEPADNADDESSEDDGQ